MIVTESGRKFAANSHNLAMIRAHVAIQENSQNWLATLQAQAEKFSRHSTLGYADLFDTVHKSQI